MDVLVLLEECDEHVAGRPGAAHGSSELRPFAYLHSAPDSQGRDRGLHGRGPAGAREIVTLCGEVNAARLALALAAAVEGRRAAVGPASATRQLGVWEGIGAFGDAAWRDRTTGQLVSDEVSIPAATLAATAADLLRDAGRLLHHTAAELGMRDWPEGTRRAISFTLPLRADLTPPRFGAAAGDADLLLASLREADGDLALFADAFADDPADGRLA